MFLPSSFGTKVPEATGDPACDGSGGDPEVGTDRTVALVAAEEPVEDLLALLAELSEAGSHGHRLVELRDHLVGDPFLRLFDEHDAARRPQQVEAAVAGQLAEPGADRVVRAERAEPFVRLCEDILKDVFGVVLGQPERLRRDREDVAGESLDERVPRGTITATAARDEIGVRRLGISRPPVTGGLTRLGGAKHPGEDLQ